MLPILLSLALLAADPPAAPNPIRLPDMFRPADPAPPSPTPMPGPVTPTVLKLTPDTLFVIDWDVPVIVLTSPPGLVVVSKEAGPLRVKGVFADSNGKSATRTFLGKFVYTIDATHTGAVEIIVVPEGAKTDADVIRRTINVDAGEPTPRPGPAPAPTPTPADPFAAAVLGAYTADPSTDKAVNAARLASVYRAAAKTTAQDAGVKTYGDLFADMESAGRAMGVPPPPYLAGVRKAVGDRLGKTLESRSTAIDRGLAAKELTAVADALAGCK